MARHAGAGAAAIFLKNNLLELLECDFVPTDVEQSSNDGSHHISQEAVGGDGEDPARWIDLRPCGMGDDADVGFNVGVQF